MKSKRCAMQVILPKWRMCSASPSCNDFSALHLRAFTTEQPHLNRRRFTRSAGKKSPYPLAPTRERPSLFLTRLRLVPTNCHKFRVPPRYVHLVDTKSPISHTWPCDFSSAHADTPWSSSSLCDSGSNAVRPLPSRTWRISRRQRWEYPRPSIRPW